MVNTSDDKSEALAQELWDCVPGVFSDSMMVPVPANLIHRVRGALRASRSASATTERETVLLETIRLVRGYPDFDNPGPFSEAMDQALRGEIPTLLVDAAHLRLGLKPPTVVSHVALTPLSAENKASRMPLPPEVLASALQDRIETAEVFSAAHAGELDVVEAQGERIIQLERELFALRLLEGMDALECSALGTFLKGGDIPATIDATRWSLVNRMLKAERELAEAKRDRDACAEDARQKDDRIARLVSARSSTARPVAGWLVESEYDRLGTTIHQEDFFQTYDDAQRWHENNGGALVPLYRAAAVSASAFTPTHRHADGGLYRLVAEAKYKPLTLGWSDCIIYEAEDRKLYVTTPARWADRFTAVAATDGGKAA